MSMAAEVKIRELEGRVRILERDMKVVLQVRQLLHDLGFETETTPTPPRPAILVRSR